MTPRKGSVIFVLIAGAIGVFFMHQSPPVAPKLEETWWGPESTGEHDKSIRPFRIVFPKEVISDLKSRLANTRELTPQLENVGQTYGVKQEIVTLFTKYWLNEYNFTAREKHLNRYSQFVTNIQGLDIHFIHVKPTNVENKKVLPLLILHGWPGSIVEFYKIIPLLTTPRPEFDFVFEVIAPSLPGFGFSDGAVKPGLGIAQMAVIFKNFMLRLGFDKFYVQGGDWGAFISANIASMYPNNVLGLHSNMCYVMSPLAILKTIIFSIYPPLIVSSENYHLMYPLSEKTKRLIEMSGYFHIQATKPDTIGVAMTDSPVGMAAYLLEKFSDSINPTMDFGKELNFLEKYTKDELIDNFMMYWVPNSMTTAMRIYAESLSKSHLSLRMDSVPINVPSACAQFPNEIVYQPESFLKERFVNLVHIKRLDRGGHFAAFEEPHLLSDEIWTSIKIMENIR